MRRTREYGKKTYHDGGFLETGLMIGNPESRETSRIRKEQYRQELLKQISDQQKKKGSDASRLLAKTSDYMARCGTAHHQLLPHSIAIVTPRLCITAERPGSGEEAVHHSMGGATVNGRGYITKGEGFHHLINGFRGMTAAEGEGSGLSPLLTMPAGSFDNLPRMSSLVSPSRERNLENASGNGSEDSWILRADQAKGEDRIKQEHHVRWADEPQERDGETSLDSRGVVDGSGAPENWWGKRETLPLTSDASSQTEGPTMRTQGTQMSSKKEEAHSPSVLSFSEDLRRISPEFRSDHVDTKCCTPDTKDVSCDQPRYFISNHTDVADSCEASTETEPGKLDSYKLELKKQIEEKKRRRAEEEERMRLEDERDERRLAEQILQLQQQYEKEKQRESHSCKMMRDEWLPQ